MTREQIQELREKAHGLAVEAREILTTEPREGSSDSEQQVIFDKMLADVDEMRQRADNEERMLAVEDSIAAERVETEVRDTVRNVIEPSRTSGKATQAIGTQEVRSALWVQALGGDQGAYHQLLELDRDEQRVLGGSTSAGGAVLPKGQMHEVWFQLRYSSPMLNPDVVTVIHDDTARDLPVPIVAVPGEGNNTGTYGGGEAADDGSDDPTFSQKNLYAFLFYTAWVKWAPQLAVGASVSMEMLLTQALGTMMGNARMDSGNTPGSVGRRLSHLLTRGSGSSQPGGIAEGSTKALSCASETDFTADELIDLYYHVDAAYRAQPKCCWMMNDDTIKKLRKKRTDTWTGTLSDGTVYSQQYLWQPGLTAAVPDMVLGKPLYPNNEMEKFPSSANTTAEKVILFGDASRYLVRLAGPTTMRISYDNFAPNIGIMAYQMADGKLIDTSAVKHMAAAS